MDLGEAVTRKVGPLPIWAYGAIIATGVWGYYLWTGRGASDDSTDVGALYPASAGDSFSGVQDETGTVPVVSGGTVQSTGGTGAPTDNLAWYMVASNYLTGFNYDAVSVSNALTHYLQGTALTVAERALVNQAVGRYGQPPEGVPESPGGTPAPPTLPTTPGGDGRGGTETPVPRVPGKPHIHHITTTSTTATVNWDAPTGGATRYIVYKGTGAVAVNNLPPSARSYTVTGLKPRTRYSFSVAGFGPSDIRGPYSNVVTVTTKA